MNSFLPSGYKAPQSSGQFMKLQDGENKFRIMTPAVIGWEGWKENKPFRRKGVTKNVMENEVDIDRYGKPKINHFWAFVVWDYADKKIKVLSITQSSIQKKIENYYISDDWGDPVNNYDFIVKRYKEGDMTKYDVLAIPPKVTPTEIADAFREAEVDLEKLFTNEYPMQEANPDAIPF